MRIKPFGTLGTPCEQPAPARIAYRRRPMNAISATPLTREPRAALVWLDGSPSTTVVRLPSESNFEIREPTGLPRYGPTGGTTTQSGSSGGSCVPPTPASATYSLPSGPNLSPRGLFRFDAKVETTTDGFRASR